MTKYIARRLLLLVAVVFGMSIITFVISHAIPGDPARLAAGLDADAEQIAAVRQRLGLDRPLPEQYVNYLAGLLRGDLGNSIHTRRPVLTDLRAFFPATLELTVAAALIGLLISVPLGVFAAMRRGTVDLVSRMFALGTTAIPVFWLGLIAQIIFYQQLGWFPAGGRLGGNQDFPNPVTGMYLVDAVLLGDPALAVDVLKHLALPALVLAQIMVGPMTRMTRSSVLEVMGEDFVRTARAKGLSQRAIVIRHVLRNAAIPVISVFGLQFGGLLSGAILTESIFSWPGLGTYALNAISTLDFPAIMGTTLLISILYVLLNLLVDISYAVMDPRVQF
jgi:peptide/nickel transport system permease protein